MVNWRRKPWILDDEGEKNLLTYVGKRKKNIAIVLYSKLFYERADYRKSQLWHKRSLIEGKKVNSRVLKV